MSKKTNTGTNEIKQEVVKEDKLTPNTPIKLTKLKTDQLTTDASKELNKLKTQTLNEEKELTVVELVKPLPTNIQNTKVGYLQY